MKREVTGTYISICPLFFFFTSHPIKSYWTQLGHLKKNNLHNLWFVCFFCGIFLALLRCIIIDTYHLYLFIHVRQFKKLPAYPSWN